VRRIFLLLLLLLPLTLFAAEQKIEVVPLHYQSADALLPQLAPFITPPEQISGIGNQLIIRAGSKRLTELKAVIKQLDVRPHQFHISLRQGQRSSVVHSGEGADGIIRYESRSGNATGEARVRIHRSHNRSDSPSNQQLRVLEGRWGTIHVGRSVPIGAQRVTRTPWGRSVEQQIRYQDVMSGFQINVRLTGDRTATLTIAPQRQQMGSGGVIHKQQMESMISLPLGEWVEIGANLDELEQRGSGTVYRTGARGWSEQRIELKVELVP